MVVPCQYKLFFVFNCYGRYYCLASEIANIKFESTLSITALHLIKMLIIVPLVGKLITF